MMPYGQLLIKLERGVKLAALTAKRAATLLIYKNSYDSCNLAFASIDRRRGQLILKGFYIPESLDRYL